MNDEKDKRNLEQANTDLEKDDVNKGGDKEKSPPKETTIEEKLKDTEEKLLRSLAEIENQRRRFEKEIKEMSR